MSFKSFTNVRILLIAGFAALLALFFQNCSLNKMSDPIELQTTSVINTFSDEPTFTEISEKLLKPRCVDCHSSGTLNYTSYESLISSNTVVPGKPEESKLYLLVVSGEMPETEPKLTYIDIAAIKKWIEAGAKNDKPGTAPLQIQNLAANALNPNQVNLSWSLGSENTTSVVVERATLANTGPFGVVASLNTAATTYNDTNLMPATKYYYRVLAKNFYGQSDYSGVVEVATPDFPPLAPGGLAASEIQQNQLRLTWVDNSGDETEFRLEKSLSAAGPFTMAQAAAANSTSLVHSGLNADTNYFFRIAAYSTGGGLSTYSNTVSIRTLPVPTAPPTMPGGLAVTALSSSQILVSWTDNSNDELGFRVERSLAQNGTYSLVNTTAASVTSYTDSSLQASTAYYYRIAAYNAAGVSSYTAVRFASTNAQETSAPNAPGSLTATANSSTQITLSWTDNSNNETGFKIESSQNSSGPFTEIATLNAGTNSYVNSGLMAAQTYYYRVRAYNSVGNSAYSAVVNTATLGTAPTAPSGLAATAISATQINLAWNDNSDNETQFKIERATSQTGPYSEIVRTSANINTYSNTGLSTAVTYYYRVSAVNSNGTSNVSNIISATTFGTFNWINANVIQPTCIECHAGVRPKGSYDMSTYTATITRVVSGNSTGSLLYQQVLDGSMPKNGSLSTQQINSIKTWIDSGAPNN